MRAFQDRGIYRIEYRRYGRTTALKGLTATHIAAVRSRLDPGPGFQASHDAAKSLSESGAHLISKQVGIGRSDKAKKGTLRFLVQEYLKSSDYSQLGPTTKTEHKRLMNLVCLEPTSRPGFMFGDYPIERLEAKHVKELRDRKKSTPNAANHVVNKLRVLFRWACDNDKGMTTNPAKDVSKLRISSEGHHSWSDDEREKFKTCFQVGTMERLAYELFFGTGQRLGDIVAMGNHTIVNGKLVFVQEKNRARKAVPLELPILPDLQNALDMTVNKATQRILSEF